MSSPETTGLKETPILETNIPGVTVQGINETDLPDVKALFEKNMEHAGRGGVASDEALYDLVVRDVTDGNGFSDNRLKINYYDKLVGYVGAVPKDNPAEPDLVELSYFVDEDFIKKGFGKAAVSAVITHEEKNKKTVFAVVDPKNEASLKLLEALGLKESHVDGDMRMVLAKRALVSDEMLELFGMM